MKRIVFYGFFLSVLAGCAAQADTASAFPLSHVSQRTILISFGMYITPETSPLPKPEKYSGYHTATDFEIVLSEQDTPVPVMAICTGSVIYSGFATGYGGVLVHRCTIDGQEVTVLYGHIALRGLPKKGATVRQGQKIAALAPAYSRESGGARKHLHLGIHRGSGLVFLGYVPQASRLREWIDPLPFLSRG